MANVKFIVRNLNAKAPQTICLLFHYPGGDKLIFSTKHKVNPKLWNQKTGTVRNMTEADAKDIINKSLSELRTSFETELQRRVADKEPTDKDAMRLFLTDYMNPKEIEKKDNTFHGFFKDFLKHSSSKVNPKTGKPVVYTTQRKYYQCYNELLEYEKKYQTTLTWEKIDLDFYHNFVELLQEKGQAVNNIGKHIKTLKTVLNEATDKGVNKSFAYKSSRFKALTENSEAIYLNEDELQAIAETDFSKHPKLERVRDLFLVGCWTGLRFQNYTSLTPEDIKGNMIDVLQFKTLEKVVIPLHPIVEIMLNKYSGTLPKAPSNQKFNDYIKEVVKVAGISNPVSKAITKGGTRQTGMYKKFQLVSSHTARRSFATNLYKSGFPSLSIMKITGHKTEQAFMKYIKVTPDEHAQLLRLHWAKQGVFMKVVNS
jgi:integrase